MMSKYPIQVLCMEAMHDFTDASQETSREAAGHNAEGCALHIRQIFRSILALPTNSYVNLVSALVSSSVQ